MAFDIPSFGVASNYLASNRYVGPKEGFANVLSNSATNTLAKIPGENQAMISQLAERALAEQGGIRRQKLVNDQAAENNRAALARDYNIFLQQGEINRLNSNLKSRSTLFDKLNLAASLAQNFTGNGSARGASAASLQGISDPLALLNSTTQNLRAYRNEVGSALSGSSGMTANVLKSLPSVDTPRSQDTSAMLQAENTRVPLQQQAAPSVLRGSRAQDDQEFMNLLKQGYMSQMGGGSA